MTLLSRRKMVAYLEEDHDFRGGHSGRGRNFFLGMLLKKRILELPKMCKDGKIYEIWKYHIAEEKEKYGGFGTDDQIYFKGRIA